jgi:hypothetical protein
MRKNTYNVNKTFAHLQTTGGIVFYAEIVPDITTRNSERKAT